MKTVPFVTSQTIL